MRLSTTRMTTAALMTALTTVGAYLVIPVGPVPVTMQSGVVLTAGALLGSRWGALSQAVYVIMGLAGMPVFAGGRSGPGAVLSPTFGYLAGFIAAAFITGWCIERFSHLTTLRLLLAMLTGTAVLDLFGLTYLYFHFNVLLGQPTSWPTVLSVGLIPFLPFDAIKMMLAVAVVTTLGKRLAISQTETSHPSQPPTIPG